MYNSGLIIIIFMVDKLTPEQIERFKGAFNLFDKDGDGTIKSKEVGTVMRALGLNPTESEVVDLLNEVDEGNGLIDFPEFLVIMARMVDDGDDESELLEAFRNFDKERTKKISMDVFRNVVMNMGEKINEDELNEFIESVDLDPHGDIEYEELVKLILTK